MATSYTALLGLALPVTGELQGTWGDTVNNQLTSLLDTAVAGTTTISTDADVTLSTTTGAANQARQAIILWTANGSTTRNITAPAQSKTYVVINASAGTQSIVIRGVGPTTGVTVAKGEKVVVAWDGSDFVRVSAYGGTGEFTTVDTTNLEVTNIKAKDGTASMTLADATGVASFSANPVLSGGTANGVLYLDGSKVATSGSALTFDGSRVFTVDAASGNSVVAAKAITNQAAFLSAVGHGNTQGSTSFDIIQDQTFAYVFNRANTPMVFGVNNAEQMRLTSTGLGIGTSSPGAKLDVQTTGQYLSNLSSSDAAGGYITLGRSGATAIIGSYNSASGGGTTINADALFFRNANGIGFGSGGAAVTAFLDSSGNLGLGVTPSAWTNGRIALQIGGSTVAGLGFAGAISETYTNAYVNSGVYKYYTTGPAGLFDFNNAASGGFSWRIAGSGTAGNAISFTQAMTLDASGNLGIGTSSPLVKLVVSNSGAAGFELNPNAAGLAQLETYNRSTAAYVGFRINADDVRFHTGVGVSERARITSGGNFKIGGTADRATTEGDKQLVLFDGTAPVGTLANGVSFYSASGEANVMDAAGNATLLSPHDAETNEWIFRSKHTPSGKVLKIDVERLLKFVNDHFGLDAVHEFIEP